MKYRQQILDYAVGASKRLNRLALRFARNEKNMSIADLTLATGVTEWKQRSWEEGGYLFSVFERQEIANALGVRREDVFPTLEDILNGPQREEENGEIKEETSQETNKEETKPEAGEISPAQENQG
jgi:transcriptional regulator with XRE-family HTH domain